MCGFRRLTRGAPEPAHLDVTPVLQSRWQGGAQAVSWSERTIDFKFALFTLGHSVGRSSDLTKQVGKRFR
jgi:hypothetical protein